MKMLNTGSVFKLVAGFVLLGLMLHSQTFAVGTDESTPVDNQATIDYSVGGVVQPQILSDDPSTGTANDATRFLVDELIDMSIAAAPAALGTTGTVGETVVLTVQNDGNGTQTFLLGFLDFDTGDDLDVVSVSYFEDDGVTSGQVDPTNTPIPTGEITLTEDENRDILAVAVLSGSTNGDEAAVHYTLTASNGAGAVIAADDGGTAFDPATVQIVFADGDNTDVTTNTASTDDVEDGLASSGSVTYTVAGLIVQKTVAVTANPAGITDDANPKAVPGATVTYTITIDNTTGSSDATSLDISDTVPVELSLNVLSVSPDGFCVGVTDTSAGNTVTLSGMTVASGTTCTVTFTAEIL